MQKPFVKFRWTCLNHSFTWLLILHYELWTEKSLLASTFVHLFYILNIQKCLIWAAGSREKNKTKHRFSRTSVSSYDFPRKDVFISIVLSWIAFSFAISPVWWGDQNWKGYSGWGLTWLIYNGRNISLLIKKKYLFINQSIILPLPATSSHCWKNLTRVAMITQRSLILCTFTMVTQLFS